MIAAALYARYSSDLQSARSVADQLDVLRREAAGRGWRVVAEYADEAISGASMGTRQALQAMLADAADGAFQIVMAEALDRISRDQADTALIHRTLAFADVQIVTLSEQEVTPLHVGFKGLMNSMFLTELAAKTRRGLASRVRDGASAGGRAFGYQTAETGALVIDAAEAEVVREIHRRFATGESARVIAKDLNARNVPSPRGGEWQASTILGQARHGNGILNNELYAGRRIWNRRRKVTDPVTGRKRMKENPPEKWISEPAPALAILTPEEWAATKAAQRALAPKRGGARRRPTRPLSGLIICAACGGPMTITAKDRYGCSHRRERGTCSEGRTVPARAIESRVFRALEELLAGPDTIEAAAKAWHSARAANDGASRRRRLDLQTEISQLDGKIARAVDAIVEGQASPSLGARLAEMEAQRLSAAAELEKLTPVPVAFLPAGSEVYAGLVRQLAEAAADQQAGGEVRAALRGLISGITVSWSEAGSLRLSVEGDLAGLMASAKPQTQKTPGAALRGAEGSLRLGAGTRTIVARTSICYRVAA